jgi:adenosylcobinamide-phosphate synthase
MRWCFGKEGYSGGFGDSIIALEKLMGYIPNVFGGFLIALAGILTPTAGMTRAFLGLGRPKGQASYEEGGLPLTAAAYALNVSLGGPTTDLDGDVIKRHWIGPDKATAKLGSVHLHRVVYITFMAMLLFIAGLSFAMIFAGNGFSGDFWPF